MNPNAINRLLAHAGLEAKRPAYGVTKYPAGHLFLHAGTGSLFRNIGNQGYGIFTNDWSDRYVLEERFVQPPQLTAVRAVGISFDQTALQAAFDSNPNFEVLGTNATSATVTLATGGGIKLTTTTGSADSVIILPHLTVGTSWRSTLWKTTLHPTFDCVIKTGATASMATQKIWAGFKKTNTPVTVTDTDQTFFRFSSDTEATSAQAATGTTGVHTPAVWECIDSASNVDTIQSSGVTVAIDTYYWLRIQVLNLVPHYFINGSLVKKGNALTTDVSLIPYIGIGNLTTSARSMIIRSLKCGLKHSAVTGV